MICWREFGIVCIVATTGLGCSNSPKAVASKPPAAPLQQNSSSEQTVQQQRQHPAPHSDPPPAAVAPAQNSPSPAPMKPVPAIQQTSASSSPPISFRTPEGGDVSLEGVCAVSEDSVACWDSGGAPNRDLEGRLLTTLSSNNGMHEFQLTFGKKNRFVVLRVANVTDWRAPSSLYVESVGPGDLNGRYGFPLVSPPASGLPPSGASPTPPSNVYRVAVDKSVTTTSALIRYVTRVAGSARLDVKPGASVQFAGETHKIVSIDKPSSPPRMSMERERWEIEMESTQLQKAGVEISIVPLDAAGHVIMHCDNRGNPLTEQQYQQLLKDLGQRSGAISPSQMVFPSPTTVIVSRSSDSSTTFTLFVDPKKITALKLEARMKKTATLTGIPLDPR